MVLLQLIIVRAPLLFPNSKKSFKIDDFIDSFIVENQKIKDKAFAMKKE